VEFMLPQLTQSSFLPKNQMLQNGFFYICDTDGTVSPKIGCHFDNEFRGF